MNTMPRRFANRCEICEWIVDDYVSFCHTRKNIIASITKLRRLREEANIQPVAIGRRKAHARTRLL